MLRKILGKIADGRFGRALAGLQAGWQWDCRERKEALLQGTVRYDGKAYDVSVQQVGKQIKCRCSCRDAVYTGAVCKHIAFACMAELAYRASERSKHREVELGG
ncbi:MAG: SWIM zinc finger family protein [Desulfotomaculum sp.]|nr:SWIM zinc finger family protein [Desulfotomaculum sp.]MBO8138247.1 SWIM zinc finger family protein [Desulfotomaculum sp.]